MSDVADEIELIIMSGVEGPSVYLDDHRISGPKPWGGGGILGKFNIKTSELRRLLDAHEKRRIAARQGTAETSKCV